MDRIHLNSAGAGLMSHAARAAIVQHLDLEAHMGAYEAAESVSEQMDDLRIRIGQLVCREPDEIALCDSATRGWNTIVYGLTLPPTTSIVVSRLDFGSCLASLVHRFVGLGHKIIVAPCDEAGRINVEKLSDTIRSNVSLVAISHAPAHAPICNPIVEVSELCAKQDVPLIVDACQSLGVHEFPNLSNRRIAICGTGRKWLAGPRGTGFLAVSKSWIEEIDPPTIELANSDPELFRANRLNCLEILKEAKRFELWEKSIANFLGLRVAVSEYLVNKLGRQEQTIRRSNELKSHFGAAVAARIIQPDLQDTGVVALRIGAKEVGALKKALRQKKINFSINSPWDAPLDFEARNLENTIRLSPHFGLSAEQMEQAAKSITDAFAECSS